MIVAVFPRVFVRSSSAYDFFRWLFRRKVNHSFPPIEL